MPLLNSFCLGALLVSVSAFFSARYLYQHRDVLEPAEVDMTIPLLAWSLLWWCGAGIREISMHLTYLHRQDTYLLFATGTAVILALLRQRLAWRYLSVPVLLLRPVMTFACGAFVTGAHPMARLGSVAWISAIASHYWIQRRLESDGRSGRRVAASGHADARPLSHLAGNGLAGRTCIVCHADMARRCLDHRSLHRDHLPSFAQSACRLAISAVLGGVSSVLVPSSFRQASG